jgi:nucleoside 2-deoxyribosyltransferase
MTDHTTGMYMTNHMKMYVAAPWIWRERARKLAYQIIETGHQVNSRWLWQDDGVSETVGARQDLEDIDMADAIVLMTMPKGTMFSSGGRMVELGYAMAKGKRVMIVGDRENVFCYLPQVLQFNDGRALVAALRQMEPSHVER